MKKILYGVLAIMLVTASAFTLSNNSSRTKPVYETMYFKYLPADNSEGDFELEESWEFLRTSNPDDVCDGFGTDACIVRLTNIDNPGIDPLDDENVAISAFVEFLSIHGVDPSD